MELTELSESIKELFDFETLEEACLFVLEEYGEYSLKRCGYEIANIEFREITESEGD